MNSVNNVSGVNARSNWDNSDDDNFFGFDDAYTVAYYISNIYNNSQANNSAVNTSLINRSVLNLDTVLQQDLNGNASYRIIRTGDSGPLMCGQIA